MLALLSAALADAANIFSQNFAGDLTYYGRNDESTGNCKFGVTGASTLPWTTGLTGAKFVALDRALYFDAQGSAAQCGLCLALYGDPANAGCKTCGTSPVAPAVTYVMVADQCPEVRPSFRAFISCTLSLCEPIGSPSP